MVQAAYRNEFFLLRDIWKARKRIGSIAKRTPLTFSQPLSSITGASVYLKLENMQDTGAFKIRGAANKILSLSKEQREKGVATFSTGNHGIAVAYVANQLNIPATVCISNRVPTGKVNRLKQLGAKVEVVGENQDDAEAYCYELESKYGITVVKPFDDLDVIAGQGTIGIEIIDDLPEIDHVVIPLSGGGLLAGIAYFLKHTDPAIHVTGVTMEHAAVMHESLKQGKAVNLPEVNTLADSLLGGIGKDNRHTFSMIKQYIDKSELVSEDSIAQGILAMMDHHKMVIEGAAAAGVGWLLQQQDIAGQNIVIVITGNNIDQETIEGLL
ncbi:threonine/serine dehydratase [Terrihalobacillus insolitus]|uniref:threonine/serine dehydratase n=1 Tax=Terrihalobacillus insolitus TaxID=2950438 RepID=UPI0023413450|nr:threonine/serine dehydratase [Terrihalobacillus insolitus]MDC3415064.1 threonine/serine dehydratase [Terrihalobacillus insolitus]